MKDFIKYNASYFTMLASIMAMVGKFFTTGAMLMLRLIPVTTNLYTAIATDERYASVRIRFEKVRGLLIQVAFELTEIFKEIKANDGFKEYEQFVNEAKTLIESLNPEIKATGEFVKSTGLDLEAASKELQLWIMADENMSLFLKSEASTEVIKDAVEEVKKDEVVS